MKRVFIFAHYDKNNTLQPYILDELNLLSKLGEIIFISDSYYIDNLPQNIRFTEVQTYRHGLYDAYSYYLGFKHLKDTSRLSELDFIYFINSSIIFPKSSRADLLDCIAAMENSEADIWGMCKSHYLLQSYWLGCKKKTFETIDEFWKKYKHCYPNNIYPWFEKAKTNTWTMKRYNQRKEEVGEELALKWIYTVVHFENNFSKYMSVHNYKLLGADNGCWPNSRFITKAPR